MNNITKGIITLIILILIISGIVYLWNRLQNQRTGTTNEQQTQSNNQQTQSGNGVKQISIYENTSHGYMLAYPGDLTANEYSPNSVVFGTVDDDQINGVVEAGIFYIEGEQNESLEKASAQQLIDLCAADSPTITISCTEASETTEFTTDSGIGGYKIRLKGEQRNLNTNETTDIEKGPFYIFPITTSGNTTKAILIHPPLNINTDQANQDAVESVARSLEIDEAARNSDPRVEQYVRDNISQLSPVDAQVGGTFYVTEVKTQDGNGIVEYEDGHVAYTANFSYSVDNNGNITVNTFEITPN